MTQNKPKFLSFTLKKIRLIIVLGKYAQTNIRREYTAADDPIKGEKEFSKAGKMLYEIINNNPPEMAP